MSTAVADPPVSQAPRKKEAPTLHPTRFQEAEFATKTWFVTVEHGVTIEQARDPAFWAHIAQQVKPYEEFKVVQEDGSWVAQLLVLATDRTWVRTHLLAFHDLTKEKVVEPHSSAHRVEWKGPHHKWVVIRNSDGAMVKTKIDSKEAAARELLEHERIT